MRRGRFVLKGLKAASAYLERGGFSEVEIISDRLITAQKGELDIVVYVVTHASNTNPSAMIRVPNQQWRIIKKMPCDRIDAIYVKVLDEFGDRALLRHITEADVDKKGKGPKKEEEVKR